MANTKLTDRVNELKSAKVLETYDEPATKQFIILKILDALGWDVFEIADIKPEYPVDPKHNKEKVDYALAQNTDNMVFVEAKAVNVDLENGQKQFLTYCFQHNVAMGALTNGISWWLYLPREKGSWYERKFYSIDLIQQDTNTIVSKFEEFLSKSSVTTGKAMECAKKTLESKQKDKKIMNALPQAWNKLISDEDDTIVEALRKMVEKISGHSVQDDVISKFLEQKIRKFWLIEEESEQKYRGKEAETKDGEKPAKNFSKGYAYKKITAFSFNNNKYPVKSWKQLLLSICNEIRKNHSRDFYKVLSLKGKKRPYFSKNSNELRKPEKIKGTDIFVETNLSADAIVKICEAIVHIFGYKSGLIIDAS